VSSLSNYLIQTSKTLVCQSAIGGHQEYGKQHPKIYVEKRILNKKYENIF